MKTADFLRQHDNCPDGAEWALSIGDDMSDVWNAMIKEVKREWLIWTATRPGVFPGSVLRKLACRFVRETPVANGRTVWDLLTDERSRKAIEVAEAYVDGKVTKKELVAAASYAAASYAASAYDAVSAASAAHHASYAALAAARVAYASARAADHAVWASSAATRAAFYAAAWDACAAASAAHHAADAAADAARAAARDAYWDADAAQIRMIAALGNPFKEENDHENR